jgi:transcriptional regulator with XRE-family HTH domain
MNLKEHLKKSFNKDPSLKNDVSFENWLNNLGLVVAELRKSKGYTQKDLADRMGVKQSVIARIESGHNMNCKTLWTLTDALGKDLNVLGTSKFYGRANLDEFLANAPAPTVNQFQSRVSIPAETAKELMKALETQFKGYS